MKKTIKRISLIVIAVLTLTVVLGIMMGCKANEQEMLNESKNALKSASFDVSVYDGAEKVYGYKKTVTLQENKAEIATEESKLNSSFVLESNTTYDSAESPDMAKLISINLSDELIQSKDTSGNDVTLKVAKENLSKVIGLNDYQPIEDVTVVISFESNKIRSLNTEFVLESGRKAVITYTYSY